MNDKPSLISRFFRGIWKTVQVIYQAFIVISLLVFAAVVWVAVRGAPTTVDDNVALLIAPSGVLVEQMDQDPGERFFESISGDPPSQTLVRDLVEALDYGREDARINMAVLKLDALWGGGVPQLQELAGAMERFKAAGKPVYVYGEFFDQSHYLLAAHASEVTLDPMGLVFLEGYSVYNNYFKEGLDKLGVEANVFRVGEYKSAVEPFERNDMSPEAEQANLDWLGDLWRRYGGDVAQARKLPSTAVDDYIVNLNAGLAAAGNDAAEYARQQKLVDVVEPLVAFRSRMGERVGMDDDHGSFRQIYYGDYLKAARREHRKRWQGDEPQVALVVVQGEIVDGFGDQGLAGGDEILDYLDEARLDDDVKAVVLRVDSPGGSVFASEKIRRGVQQLQAEGKPVVASMGTVAASGGYWIAMDADEIWAHEATVTGSIGIFALWPTIEQPLAKLGIHTDGVGTTPLAGAFRMDRPLSPEARALIQSELQRGYRQFVEGVAKGRELDLAAVEQIARGRVWSGEDARTQGLVDQLGTLQQAADAAARLADLPAGGWRLREIKPELEWVDRMLIDMTGEVRVDFLQRFARLAEPLRAAAGLADKLRWLNDPRGLYSHCFCVPSAARRAVR